MSTFDLRTGLEIELLLPEGSTRLRLLNRLAERLGAELEIFPFFSKVPVPIVVGVGGKRSAELSLALIQDVARHHGAKVHAVSPDLRYFYLAHTAGRLIQSGKELLRIVHDNTLAGGERVAEIVTAPLFRSELDLVDEVLETVSEIGDVEAPPGAGLHVHLDGAQFFHVGRLRALVAAYLHFEPALRSLVRTPPGLRRARALPPSLVSELASLPEETPWPEAAQVILRHVHDRSFGLNLYNLALAVPTKPTVEFKIAASTADAAKVIEVRELYVRLAAFALSGGDPLRYSADAGSFLEAIAH